MLRCLNRCPGRALIPLLLPYEPRSLVTEDDHFVERAVLGREGDKGTILVVAQEMTSHIGVFVRDIFRAYQSHDTARHEPIGGRSQELLFNPMTAIAVIEGRVEPDERKPLEAGSAAQEVCRRQDVGFGQKSVKRLGTALIQLDGKGSCLWTPEQVAQLPDRRPFSGTWIEHGEGIVVRRT